MYNIHNSVQEVLTVLAEESFLLILNSREPTDSLIAFEVQYFPN